jgi:hypothetical protein
LKKFGLCLALAIAAVALVPQVLFGAIALIGTMLFWATLFLGLILLMVPWMLFSVIVLWVWQAVVPSSARERWATEASLQTPEEKK